MIFLPEALVVYPSSHNSEWALKSHPTMALLPVWVSRLSSSSYCNMLQSNVYFSKATT